jgi:hypothetical protein
MQPSPPCPVYIGGGRCAARRRLPFAGRHGGRGAQPPGGGPCQVHFGRHPHPPRAGGAGRLPGEATPGARLPQGAPTRPGGTRFRPGGSGKGACARHHLAAGERGPLHSALLHTMTGSVGMRTLRLTLEQLFDVAVFGPELVASVRKEQEKEAWRSHSPSPVLWLDAEDTQVSLEWCHPFCRLCCWPTFPRGQLPTGGTYPAFAVCRSTFA